jgi:hypothetical protein
MGNIFSPETPASLSTPQPTPIKQDAPILSKLQPKIFRNIESGTTYTLVMIGMFFINVVF